MAAEKLGQFPWLTSLFRLQQLEQCGHGERVVAGSKHHLGSDLVRLVLVIPAELQKYGIETHATDRVQHLRGAAGRLPEQSTEQPHSSLGKGRLRGLVGTVPKRHVRHLVSQHAGELGLAPRRLDQPAITYIGPPGSANALISSAFTALIR